MNTDLLVYCDNLDGTIIDFAAFPNYPKFRWFWERISPYLTDTDYVDKLTPTTWYEDPMIESQNPVIKKAMSNVDGDKIRATSVYVRNFLGYDWTESFNKFLPSFLSSFIL